MRRYGRVHGVCWVRSESSERARGSTNLVGVGVEPCRLVSDICGSRHTAPSQLDYITTPCEVSFTLWHQPRPHHLEPASAPPTCRRRPPSSAVRHLRVKRVFKAASSSLKRPAPTSVTHWSGRHRTLSLSRRSSLPEPGSPTTRWMNLVHFPAERNPEMNKKIANKRKNCTKRI